MLFLILVRIRPDGRGLCPADRPHLAPAAERLASSYLSLWNPVGENLYRPVGLGRIICNEVDAEVVFTAHIAVHHELHGQGRAVAGLEDHRTDGRGRRSASLHDLDIGRLGEAQGLVAHIRELKGSGDSLAKAHIAQVDRVFIRFQR